MALRQAGLAKAIPDGIETATSDALNQLLAQLRQIDHDLDWELTAEIIRLKDRCRTMAVDYARGQYGVTVGGHIKLPTMLAGLPEKLRVNALAFVDDPPHELRVEGHPVRTDGTLLSETISMLLGPEGIKLNVSNVAKRDGLRNRLTP